MSIEENKALVRRFIDEVFVAGSFAAVDELVAEDFMPHTWGSMGSGRQALKDAITRVSTGLTDTSMTIEDMIAEDDRVAVRLTSRAVQIGAFMGLPPSGKAYSIGEIHIFRLRDGRISEHWHEADFLGMLRQLGALPEHS
ncbi:MAG: ester cyclase [Candidatus Limnocylindrales bacterium]